jgi:hypothetical protein
VLLHFQLILRLTLLLLWKWIQVHL